MKVSVLGSGPLTAPLSALLAVAGSDVRSSAGPEDAGHGAALDHAELLFLTLPGSQLAASLPGLGLRPEHRVVVCGRGPDEATGLWLSELVTRRTPCLRVGALAGPLSPAEVERGSPAAAIIASPYQDLRARAQAALHSPRCRVYTSEDLRGVELSASAARALTAAIGMSDAMGMGAGVRGLLLSRGLAELRRLGKALGANPDTFVGLAGVGEVVAASAAAEDSAYLAGRALLRGEADPHDEAIAVTAALVKLSARVKVDLPLLEAVHEVATGRHTAKEALKGLMERAAKLGGE
ncbi:hypothetical protein L6R49_26590 [Myxococcota bacterium]|nr:hypothetical protein [Myxococcota bacterium]